MGIKATDTAGAFLCHGCHHELDAGGLAADEACAMFDVARERSAAWCKALA
ncbi:hypothetical protein [Chitinimonas arctica]|uniref:hypothetical protein n=1 Tax=Chitinimonas arctica TaxID=2594795 RepID=UPI0015D207F4|nr:hypothetical protein [Chitinimonas arctica]